MMIWLLSFIVSNYKLASGPPKDPGGSKKILSKSKDMIHRIFYVKNNYQTRFQMSGTLYRYIIRCSQRLTSRLRRSAQIGYYCLNVVIKNHL